VRLDQLLHQRGLFPSRERARRAVMAGDVEVDGRIVDKPGTEVAEKALVEVRARMPYVSRAGVKLAGALDYFGLSPGDWVCMDVGASTGGFTDCLLQRGARRVYAIDVGYGQLDYRLRNDERVVVMERVNARFLPADALPEKVRLVTVDVSFISLTKVVPALLPHLLPGGYLLPLIKPQFEAGPEAVGKGGIVRDEEVRQRVVERRIDELAALGLAVLGWTDAALAGTGGNQEVVALFAKPGVGESEAAPESAVRGGSRTDILPTE
jgi:23S rRNA (cytidine1920-2'-O)/16S rRNA (cytidine1409-2'-O)-methyltransferase